MNHHTTPEHRAQLWERYRQAMARYEAAKKVTDTAEAARDAACQACQAAHQAWETACAEEVRYGQAVRQTAVAYQTNRCSISDRGRHHAELAAHQPTNSPVTTTTTPQQR